MVHPFSFRKTFLWPIIDIKQLNMFFYKYDIFIVKHISFKKPFRH